MNKSDILKILLVKAVEETDREGRIFPVAQRQKASREVGLPPLDPSFLALYKSQNAGLRPSHVDFIQRRSEWVYKALLPGNPAFKTWLALFHFPWFFAGVCWLTAFFLGVAANELGASGRIEIIHAGILSLLAWNVGMFLLIAIQSALNTKSANLTGPLLMKWLELRLPSKRFGGVKWLEQAFQNFAATAWRVFKPELIHSLRGILHLAAVMAVLGALAGLYFRGLTYEYQAGWSSTFISAEGLHAGLNLVLGPAAWILGWDLPGLVELDRLRWNVDQDQRNAGPWIHLMAVTCLIWIVVPRLILAGHHFKRGFRVDLPFPDHLKEEPYFLRLIQAVHGHGEVALVIPFGYSPEEDLRKEVRECFSDFLGNRVEIRFQERVGYGEADSWLKRAGDGLSQDPIANYVLVLFNATATPEKEVHGEFLLGIKDLLVQGRVARHLIIGLDCSVFLRKLGDTPDPGPRLEARINAWRGIIQNCALDFICLGMSQSAKDRPVDSLKHRVWMPALNRAGEGA